MAAAVAATVELSFSTSSSTCLRVFDLLNFSRISSFAHQSLRHPVMKILNCAFVADSFYWFWAYSKYLQGGAAVVVDVANDCILTLIWCRDFTTAGYDVSLLRWDDDDDDDDDLCYYFYQNEGYYRKPFSATKTLSGFW